MTSMWHAIAATTNFARNHLDSIQIRKLKKKNGTWHSICSWRFIKTPSDLTQPANPSRSSAKTVIVTTSRPRNSVSYSLQRSKTCLRWCIPAPHFLSRMMGNLLEIMLNATFWHMVLWLFSIQIVLLLTAKPLVWGHGKPANQRIYPGETWRMRKKINVCDSRSLGSTSHRGSFWDLKRDSDRKNGNCFKCLETTNRYHTQFCWFQGSRRDGSIRGTSSYTEQQGRKGRALTHTRITSHHKS